MRRRQLARGRSRSAIRRPSAPTSHSEATTLLAEAESIRSYARVVNDPGASGGQAVTLTRLTGNGYFWWSFSPTALPAGNYTVYVRARSGRSDNGSSRLSVHVSVDGQLDNYFDQPIVDTRYRWYALQTFSYAGNQTFHGSDYSDPMLVIDKVAIESVWATSSTAITQGTTVWDGNAFIGGAVTRSSNGSYIRWDIAPNVLDPHQLYTVRIHARSDPSTGFEGPLGR